MLPYWDFGILLAGPYIFLENLVLNLLHEVEMEPNKRELTVTAVCTFEALTSNTKNCLNDICWNKWHVHHTV